MKHHTHPETYSESDPLGYRLAQLHTEKWQCEAQWCTYADHYDWAKPKHEARAKALKAEIKAAGGAEAVRDAYYGSVK